MDGSEWDFSKLPKDLHERVKMLVENEDVYSLLDIHEDYELSEYEYCCGKPLIGILNWFKHGIKEGLIT